jgi:protein-S-isoprenylcysteine O-methyltransferase Ste14
LKDKKAKEYSRIKFNAGTLPKRTKEKLIMSKIPWWKGTHGEWYVVGQIALIVLVFFGPRTCPGWPIWSAPFTWLGLIVGFAILLTGITLLIVAIFRLGSNLTAVPYPKEQGTLIETGPYQLVRHPMYCGGILIAFGWGFLVHGWLTLGYAIIMLVFFDFKSRKEERWLKGKFPGYAEYQKRVRKLIPFIY